MPRFASDVQVIDRGWKKIKRGVRQAGKLTLKVGIFEGPKNLRDGKQVVEYATALELGLPSLNIPEFGFMRHAFDTNLSQIFVAMRRGALELQAGVPVRAVLNKIGIAHREHVVTSIADAARFSPPLKKRTIQEKGHAQPLVDTGSLLNSIRHRIVRSSTVRRGASS